MPASELTEIIGNEVQESAFDLIKYVVKLHEQNYLDNEDNFFKSELNFTRGARKIIEYELLCEEDRKCIDYFDMWIGR